MEPEQFRIPARLEDLLRRDNHLAGVTYSILADYEPIVRWNDLPFFPEYTDHGKSHLESVLITSTALIPESSWQQLSSLDAALLVLSILFHDLGMHITESGFIVLVSSENDGVLAPSFDSETWAQLWETFLAEARRRCTVPRDTSIHIPASSCVFPSPSHRYSASSSS